MSRSYLQSFMKVLGMAAFLALGAWLLPAQNPVDAGFINTTTAAINGFLNTLPPPAHPVILSANLEYAHGAVVDQSVITASVLVTYVDGLKAAGAQRIDFNPAVNSINDATSVGKYDAMVAHIRELGLQLAINPEITSGEFGSNPSFQDFANAAMTAYPALAARYQPDNFVIVHEPTTMNARLGLQGTVQDWDAFVRAVAPLIKAASPHTRLGTGGFYSPAEDSFFQDFVTIPAVDFMTMDIYNDDKFPQLQGWIQVAKSKGKGIYVEETWAPKLLPSQLPPNFQSLPGGLESVAVVGTVDQDFAAMDALWLKAMATWASANELEALTPFTSPAFFMYGTQGHDRPFDPVYVDEVVQAIQHGQLSVAGQAYATLKQQLGLPEVINLSNASYPTLPTVFNPSCGTAANPCNAVTLVAPDNLVAGFGTDLATTTTTNGSFPTSLAGTTAVLVDSAGVSFQLRLYFVSPGQVNYYVPGNVHTGPAMVTVTSGDGTKTTGVLEIVNAIPGIYTADANGKGPAAAIAVIQHANGSRSSMFTFACSGGVNCSPAPINLSASDILVIELFGTGIRHGSSVGASVNQQAVTVQYHEQSGYTGEDQVNILIPPGLYRTGVVNVVLTADGQTSNTATIDLQ